MEGQKNELNYAILHGGKTAVSCRQKSFWPITTWQQFFLRTGIYICLIRKTELLHIDGCVKITCNFCLLCADARVQDEASFSDSFAK